MARSAPAPAVEAASALPGGHEELILVVDDEPQIRNVIQHTLAQNGYRVLTAASGAEVVALLARHADEIGLAIVDLIMPIMDGKATIEALHNVTPQLAIVVITGNVDALTEPGIKAGGSAYLSKPFTAQQLLRAVHQALRREG